MSEDVENRNADKGRPVSSITSVYGPYGDGTGIPGAPRSATLARVSSGPEEPRMRMRPRLPKFLGGTKNSPDAVLEPMISVYKANHPKGNTEKIELAYRTAEHYHRGQTRSSGEPYITHPLAVGTILAELGMTEATLCAALLHDTVEDTSYTLGQLTADFGEEVAMLVDGVTKLDKVKYGDSAKIETIRKLVIKMSADIRVLVIKLADRLHNMRTIGYLRADKQERIAKETLEIYAPLAHRMGMNTIKWELEDRAFKAVHPKVYDEIVRLVAKAAPQREKHLREVIDQVQKDLEASRIKAIVYGRPKNYYSIYQKMIVRGREFDEIYDLVGLRILVDSIRDCYAALGVMHTRWNPLPGRFKDYIAMPKFNMYQSLHTTVLGPGGRPVEFQIRTHEMDKRAEYGVAAHWKYKQNPNATSDDQNANLSWVHQLNEWQQETKDPGEFLDALRYEISTTEVYVFTPKGDVFTLPQGSTPIDLAYAVHTQIGHSCIGARVNGRLVSLETQLSSGDQVEILTSKSENAGPSRDWLNFVVSPRAKSKIKAYFSKSRREETIERGKDLLAKQIRRSSVPLQKLLTVEYLTSVADTFRLPDINSLYASVGEGNLSAQAVVTRLIEVEGGAEFAAVETLEDSVVTTQPRQTSTTTGSAISVDGDGDVWVKLAKCCTPVPGDEILGFITRSNGVSVHRRDCANLINLQANQPEKIVNVTWSSSSAATNFLVTVQIDALDRTGLLSDITKTLSEQGVSITSANLSTGKNMVVRIRLTFAGSDAKHLAHLMNVIRKVSSVYDVYRIRQ